MRILAISDSHHNPGVIDKIIQSQPTAKHIFFLGDIVSDIDEVKTYYPEKTFNIVSGNCDFFSLYPTCSIEIINNIKIFYTHGHTLGVKHSIDNLTETCKKNNCRIALYGHTHVSQILYEENMYIVNPGSCSRPVNGKSSYAFIDIVNNQIFASIVNI